MTPPSIPWDVATVRGIGIQLRGTRRQAEGIHATCGHVAGYEKVG